MSLHWGINGLSGIFAIYWLFIVPWGILGGSWEAVWRLKLLPKHRDWAASTSS